MEYNGHRILITMFCSLIISSVDILSSEGTSVSQDPSDKLETVVQENLTPEQLAAALIDLSFQMSQVNQKLKLDIETLRNRIFSLPKSARARARGVYSPMASSPVDQSVTPTPPSRYKKRGRKILKQDQRKRSESAHQKHRARITSPSTPSAPKNTDKKERRFFKNLFKNHRKNG